LLTGLVCLRCRARYPATGMFEGCPACRTAGHTSNVTPTYDEEAQRAALAPATIAARPPGLWRWAELLPVAAEHAVTLGEGGTPLLACPRLGARLGLARLYLKDEARNPTGSFKDRMAALVVARAREAGARVVTIASSGNAGAALAAYAARAGLNCVVFTYARAPIAMKAQMQAAGAKLVATESGPDRWTLMRACVERYGWYPASNYLDPPVGSNPYGVEAYKTIAFEIAEALGWEPPAHVVYPVCYGDGLWGGVKGFEELRRLGWTTRVPAIHAGEVWGSLTHALEDGLDTVEAMPGGSTVGISIGARQSTYQALEALRRVDGRAGRVSDDEMLAMQRLLGECEGLFAEASSVPSLVLAARLRATGVIAADAPVVAIITATGLKDPELAARVYGEVPIVAPDLDALRTTLTERYGLALDA
jgi:threonine synthase